MEYLLIYTKHNDNTVRSHVFKCKDLFELYSKVKKFCSSSMIYEDDILEIKQC
jgi:hypothetical protein